MRLDKLLATLKYGSRREVGIMIAKGQVIVNHMPITDASRKVKPATDEIEINGERLFFKEQLVLMLNKPAGVVSSTDEPGETTVIDLIKEPYRRFNFHITGRLDKDATGLVLLATSGELTHSIISPRKDVYKKYLVKLRSPLAENDVSRLENGVSISDKENNTFVTKPAIVDVLSPTECQVQIKEGKYHQIKRMFAALGNNVLELKRLAIGGLQLDPRLAPGDYREITDAEIAAIFAKE